jgi:AraC-like DNA-binding protein
MDWTNYSHEGWQYLNVIRSVCLLCFALSLLIKRDRTRAQSYLAASLVIVGIGLFCCFNYDRYFVADNNEILRPIELISNAFGGMLIMTYFVSLMRPRQLTCRYFVLFFSVILLYSLLIIITDLTFVKPTMCIKDAIENIGHPSVIIRIFGGVGVIFLDCYVAYTVISMSVRHKKFIRQYYSYEEHIDFRWIRWYILLFGVFALSILFRILNTSFLAKVMVDVVSIVTLTTIYILGFRQGAIPAFDELQNSLAEKETEKEDVCEKIESKPSKRKNNSKQQLARVEERLKKYFDKQKPYLDPDLTLSDVAMAIGTNRNYLSQLLNSRYGVNFYTFVNNHRIDYAIRLIEQEKNDSSSGLISLESGFKSRSVFYKLFRERTGYSPKEYIDKIITFDNSYT